MICNVALSKSKVNLRNVKAILKDKETYIKLSIPFTLSISNNDVIFTMSQNYGWFETL